jgi:hypothetical protein
MSFHDAPIKNWSQNDDAETVMSSSQAAVNAKPRRPQAGWEWAAN